MWRVSTRNWRPPLTFQIPDATFSMKLTPEDQRAGWTTEQVAELMRFARNDFSARRIASELGRTEESVQVKAKQLGLILGKENPSI